MNGHNSLSNGSIHPMLPPSDQHTVLQLQQETQTRQPRDTDSERSVPRPPTPTLPATVDEHETQVDEPIAFIFLMKHHIFDWIFSIVAVFGGLAIALAQPFERKFFPDDERISYEYKEDTVPAWTLLFPAALMPILAILLASGLYKRRWDEVHRATLALAMTVGLTAIITDVLKCSIGRLRPNFIDVCQPDPVAVAAALAVSFGPRRSLPASACTGSISRIHDSRQSFPSGHTSFSFAGMAFLSLFLYELLPMSQRRFGRHGDYGFYKKEFETKRVKRSTVALGFLLVLTPLMIAALIGVSRMNDNKHHPTDVIGGAFVGCASAYACWFYFVRKPIFSRNAEKKM